MKKFSIIMAAIVILLVLIYQGASYFAFEWQREECIKDFSQEKTVNLVVKDVGAVCNCITAINKEYGLMKTLLEDENSESKQALFKEAEEKCLKPHLNLDNLLEKTLEEVIKEHQ